MLDRFWWQVARFAHRHTMARLWSWLILGRLFASSERAAAVLGLEVWEVQRARLMALHDGRAEDPALLALRYR